MNRHGRTRSIARDAARLAAVACACMVALSAWTVAAGNGSPAGAATMAAATVAPSTGGSGTTFSVALPAGAACSGDSATAGYQVQSYMVKADVDPATLRYGSTGPQPVATGENFRRPLNRASNNQAYVNQFTDVQTGVISGLPGFHLGLYAQGLSQIPAGVYNVGISCTLGGGDSQVIDKVWNAQLTVASDSADPLGFSWAVSTPASTTTTTSSTTTSTTATTVDDTSTTTTTEDPATTTTTIADGPTSTPPPDDGTFPVAVADSGLSPNGFGGPTGAGVVTPSGVLPYTGSSPWSMVVWGVLLLAFGRIAVLLGRKPRVSA